MKIKVIRFIAESFLFVAAVMAVAPSWGMAMGDKVGEFNLSVAVHWGDVLLTPGTYSISAKGSGSTPMMCVHKERASGAGYFMPAVEGETVPASTAQPQLILGEKDGAVYVKELKLESEGMDLYYSPPKSKK